MRAVEEAIARQVLHGGDLATNLLEVGAVSEPRLVDCLAESFGIAAAPSGKLPAPTASVLRFVPGELAHHHGFFPLDMREHTLFVATAEPLSPLLEEELGATLEVAVVQLVAPLVRIRQAIAEHYGIPLDRRFLRLSAKLEGKRDPSPSTTPPSELHALPFGRPQPISVPSPSFGTGLPSTPPGAQKGGRRRTLPRFSASHAGPTAATLGATAALRAPPLPSIPGEPPMPSGLTEPPSTEDSPSTRVYFFPEQGGPLREPTPPPLAVLSEPAHRPARQTERVPALAPTLPVNERPKAPSQPSKAASPPDEAPPVVDKPVPDLRALWRMPRRRGPFTMEMAAREFESAASADAILATFFAFAHQFFDYAALFVVQGDRAEGRDAAGAGADRANVSKIDIPLDMPSSMARCRERRAPLVGLFDESGIDTDIQRKLDRGPHDPPHAVALIPVVVKNRVLAILYGDDGEEEVELGSIGDVIACAGQSASALERLARRKKLLAHGVELPAPPPPPEAPAPAPGRTGAMKALAHALSLQADAKEHDEALTEPEPESEPRAAELDDFSFGDVDSSRDTSAENEGVESDESLLKAIARAAEASAIPKEATKEEPPSSEIPLYARPTVPQMDAVSAPDLQKAGRRIPTRRGLAPAFDGRTESEPLAFHPLPRTPPPNATSWTRISSTEPPPMPVRRPLANKPLPREEQPNSAPAELIGDPSVLVLRLVDDDPSSRANARRAALQLSQAGGSDLRLVTQGLELLARGVDIAVEKRVLAIDALGELRVGPMVPMLIDALGDRSDEITIAAQRALVKITHQNHGRSASAWQSWWAENAPRHRIEWLIDALTHESASLRRAAGDELKLLTKEYFGYYDDLPREELLRVQAQYRAWWEREGRRQHVEG